MLQELIYTSAPQGLKPGSQGFCTVACTAGMPPNLTMRLESLSGYRHVFLPSDPNAAKNPVMFSHLVLNLGGTSWHVLSRTADAGLDYTKRTNKIAHHLVLDAPELQTSGPTTILSQPDLFLSRWDKKPEILPSDKKLPLVASMLRPCRTWQQFTGDAGWGGVLAEAVVNKRPIRLIFPPGMNLLPLIDETLAILSPEQRRQTTFTTYYCGLPADVSCQWKCIVMGSPEMAQARLAPDTLFLDLTQSVAPPPDGPFVEIARTGKRPEQPEVASQQKQVPQAVSANLDELASALDANDSPTVSLVKPSSYPMKSVVPKGKRKFYQIGEYHSEWDDVKPKKQVGLRWLLLSILLVTMIFGPVLYFSGLFSDLLGKTISPSKQTEEVAQNRVSTPEKKTEATSSDESTGQNTEYQQSETPTPNVINEMLPEFSETLKFLVEIDDHQVEPADQSVQLTPYFQNLPPVLLKMLKILEQSYFRITEATDEVDTVEATDAKKQVAL